jgi:hypothetical protein
MNINRRIILSGQNFCKTGNNEGKIFEKTNCAFHVSHYKKSQDLARSQCWVLNDTGSVTFSSCEVNHKIILRWITHVHYIAMLRITVLRIRILSDRDPGLNKWPYFNFSVCVKAINILGISVALLFVSWIYVLEHISAKKNSRRNLAKILFRSGSGSARLHSLHAGGSGFQWVVVCHSVHAWRDWPCHTTVSLICLI